MNATTKSCWFRLVALSVAAACSAGELNGQLPAGLNVGTTTNVIRQIDLPAELGGIRDVYTGHGEKLLIHIQDAHGSRSAQEAQVALLKYFYEHFGAGHILVEGGEGSLSLGGLNTFPDEETRRSVARRFFDKGELSPAEYFLISENPRVQLSGAENRMLYYRNRAQFLELVKQQKRAHPLLAKFRAELDGHIGRHCSKTLASFLKIRNRFQQHRLSFDRYFRYLAQQYETHIAGRGISFARNLEKEQTRGILLRAKRMEHALFAVLAKTKEERRLTKLAAHYGLLEKLLQLKLTRKEFEYVRAHREIISAMHYRSAREEFSALFLLAELAFDFYSTAAGRDHAISVKTLEALRAPDVETAILITGGFHTASIRQALKHARISHIVVQPNIDVKSLAFETRAYQYRAAESLGELAQSGVILTPPLGNPEETPRRAIIAQALKRAFFAETAGFGVARIDLRAGLPGVNNSSAGGEALGPPIIETLRALVENGRNNKKRPSVKKVGFTPVFLGEDRTLFILTGDVGEAAYGLQVVISGSLRRGKRALGASVHMVVLSDQNKTVVNLGDVTNRFAVLPGSHLIDVRVRREQILIQISPEAIEYFRARAWPLYEGSNIEKSPYVITDQDIRSKKGPHTPISNKSGRKTGFGRSPAGITFLITSDYEQAAEALLNLRRISPRVAETFFRDPRQIRLIVSGPNETEAGLFVETLARRLGLSRKQVAAFDRLSALDERAHAQLKQLLGERLIHFGSESELPFFMQGQISAEDRMLTRVLQWVVGQRQADVAA